ncbi:MAG: multidrug efflux SMR transporter [Deltaproteobacteria bacterium]|nr:multidrug efflux SMR transporter [Deltaproteobacteria bacterium]
MAWILVIVSGLLEAGWAIGLKASDGFTKPLPTVLTLAGMIASFILLSIAARTLPIGTAYAVWVGIGALGTVILGVIFYEEAITTLRILSMTMLVAGIVGLKLSS